MLGARPAQQRFDAGDALVGQLQQLPVDLSLSDGRALRHQQQGFDEPIAVDSVGNDLHLVAQTAQSYRAAYRSNHEATLGGISKVSE